MQLNLSTQGPYRYQNSKLYVNEIDSSNSRNADATGCTKFHHDHQTKHLTVLLTNWEDINAGTDQSTFKCTLTPPNPPPLFNRKVSKQICEHFFHLLLVLFVVFQLYICDTLVPSSSFLKTRDAETTKQFRSWLLKKGSKCILSHTTHDM